MVDPVEMQKWMAEALVLARRAGEAGEVPVGAVLVREGRPIGSGFNSPISTCDATHHAEIAAIRDAGRHCGNYRLPGSVLYVTIEPCTMCVGAMIHARVSHLVFGAPEPRAGAVVSRLRLLEHSHYNHRMTWTGDVMAEECGGLLRDFFRHRRQSSGA